MIKYGMDILGAIKKIFVKEQPQPIVVEQKRLPKSLMAEYKQDFSKFEEFNSKHRPHQINALKHLRDETIGQITIPTGTGKTRIQVDVHISDMIEKTKNNTKMTLTLALSYGSREEITKTIQEISLALYWRCCCNSNNRRSP